MNARSASTGELVVSLPSSRKPTEMLASMGAPSSVVLQRPMASKFSCMNPNGLMKAWQPAHGDLRGHRLDPLPFGGARGGRHGGVDRRAAARRAACT